MNTFKTMALAGCLAVMTGPALAQVPFCTDNRPTFSNRFEFGFGQTDPLQERASTDTMRLRRAGVDVTSLDYWNGCIRAWVRTQGGQQEQFFDPNTLRQVG
jgi:hypothetical protein